MEAFLQVGVTFGSSRPTADAEYQYGPRVSTPAPGDLVFFAGSDGTPQAPGHVGIVVNPRRHLMIDAYATGLPVEYDTYGRPTSAEGLGDPVGFTDPLAGGSSWPAVAVTAAEVTCSGGSGGPGGGCRAASAAPWSSSPRWCFSPAPAVMPWQRRTVITTPL